MQGLDNKSRMSGDVHVRFRERLRGWFPRPTRRVFWCDSKIQAQTLLKVLKQYLLVNLGLSLKPDCLISPSQRGVNYCGYRVLPGKILLNRRKKRRYQQLRLYWEQQWLDGNITSLELQQRYQSVHAITLHADSTEWRRRNLFLHPSIAIDA